MTKIVRNKLGPILDSNFENEPTYPAKNVTPLSQECLERIAKFINSRDIDPKYQPGDIIGPF
jgi:hypothetical protein